MTASRNSARSGAIHRLRGYLLHRRLPRFQMLVMVAGTGLVGFLASLLLLRLGLHALWLRYGLAVVTAYLAFLAFLWLWILFHRGRLRPGVEHLDLLEVGGDLLDVGELVAHSTARNAAPAPAKLADLPLEDPSGGSSSGLGFDLDLGELTLLVALAAAVGSGLIASFYIVASAPTLLAEVLLDGVLSAALLHRLGKIDRRHWLESALGRTWLPFLCTAAFFAVAGAVMHWYAPEAVSIGGVWQQFLAGSGV